jgi:succinate dehydrogenase/fumarate reductase cytochrome b subunit
LTAPLPEPSSKDVSVPASPPVPREPDATTPFETVRRVFGAIPLALFVFVHLALQASAHFGAHAYETATAQLLPRTASLLVSAGFVFVPLIVHAALGVRTLVRRRPPTPHESTSTTGTPSPTGTSVARATISLELARRASAFVLAVFLVGHLAHVATLPPRDPELARETFSQLTGDLSRTVAGLPLLALGYLLGVAAAVTHAASGLYVFGLRALATDSARARRRLGLTCFGWGALTFALGVHAVLVLATGVGWMAAGPSNGP